MIKSNPENIKKDRYERKFIVSKLNLNEIERIVKLNPFMFSEIFYERNVNNIYFDSHGMKSYYENIAGNFQRLKIRIRWYGKLLGLIKNPVLELKIKNGETGKKLTFPLKQFTLNKNLSMEILQKEVFDKSNLPSWLNEKLKLFQFSLLSCYRRKYFLSQNKAYRITLDHGLIFFKINVKNNSFVHKLKDRRNVILEIKYNKENDREVEKITQHFPFRLTKSSKYVSGIDLLNL